MKSFFIFLIICAIAGIWIFNRLVAQRNRVKAAWSDIEVQLTRRYDLVPQLVAAVKQYAQYEQATFQAITLLRQEALAISTPAAKGKIEERLSQGVLQLLAVAEDYPDLKASENFLELQKELVELEDYLQSARRYYNGAVRVYNTSREVFPNNLIASPLNFLEAEHFEMELEAAQVPKINE